MRAARPTDAGAWERMRQELWPADPEEHAREITAFFAGGGDSAQVLLAVHEGEIVGFAEASLRSHAEGCAPGRIAYLEGWYVEPAARRQGVGAALVHAVEAWGRTQGCRELASDTEIENKASAAAHRALGFQEVDRVVCFRKDL